MSYDSRLDTKKHINQVIEEGVKFTSKLRSQSAHCDAKMLGAIDDFINKFQRQIAKHDASKLVSPEKDGFDKYTPMLAKMEYGSDEYKKCLNELQHPYLDHHYANNSHHPEHFKNGINGMNLFDLIEMLCDWNAAVKRNKNGDIEKSLEINRDRFKIEPDLYVVLGNTVVDFGFTLCDVVKTWAYIKCNRTKLSDQEFGNQLLGIIGNTL